MNWLDPLLLLFFLIEVSLGLQRGFAWGMVGIVRFFLILGTILFLAPFLARFFPFAPREWVAVILALAVGLLFNRWLKRVWPRVLLSPRMQTLDHALGIVPGLLWGALGAAFILWVAANWMTIPPGIAKQGYERTAPCFDFLAARAKESFPGLPIAR